MITQRAHQQYPNKGVAKFTATLQIGSPVSRSNLVSALEQCGTDIQQRMLWYFSRADADYGQRVAAGLGASVPSSPPAGTPSSAQVHEAGNAVG